MSRMILIGHRNPSSISDNTRAAGRRETRSWLTLIGHRRYDRHVLAHHPGAEKLRFQRDQLVAINRSTALEHVAFPLSISSNDAYSPYQ